MKVSQPCGVYFSTRNKPCQNNNAVKVDYMGQQVNNVGFNIRYNPCGNKPSFLNENEVATSMIQANWDEFSRTIGHEM